MPLFSLTRHRERDDVRSTMHEREAISVCLSDAEKCGVEHNNRGTTTEKRATEAKLIITSNQNGEERMRSDYMVLLTA